MPRSPELPSIGSAVLSADRLSGKRAFDIQFVPTEVSARGDGVGNLLNELRSFGELQIVNQPASDMQNIGYWQLRLLTEAGQNDFSDQIDFIADNGAWRVVEDTTVTNEGAAAFGFFSDSPGAPEEDLGYGFFASPEVPSQVASPAETPLVDDDGYGFFDPLPQRGGGWLRLLRAITSAGFGSDCG